MNLKRNSWGKVNEQYHTDTAGQSQRTIPLPGSIGWLRRGEDLSWTDPGLAAHAGSRRQENSKGQGSGNKSWALSEHRVENHEPRDQIAAHDDVHSDLQGIGVQRSTFRLMAEDRNAMQIAIIEQLEHRLLDEDSMVEHVKSQLKTYEDKAQVTRNMLKYLKELFDGTRTTFVN